MYPVLTITITALVTLYLGLYSKTRAYVLGVSLGGIVLTMALMAIFWQKPVSYFSDMMRTDPYAVAYSMTLLGSTGLILGISKRFLETISEHLAEYFALLLFALAGGLIMVSFQNMTMLFIGLEILSVSVYILAGISKKDIRSNEAALKYFLMGSFFTAILLLGIAFIYGATGSFNISSIAESIREGRAIQRFMYIGVTLILVALSFKVSLAPFHFWTPDVYEGAPALVTAFMSTVVKIAGFGAFLRVFSISFSSLTGFWSVSIWILIVLTLFVGNINALYQTSMKRMLAYSSISHAGYMMMAIVAMGSLSSNALLIYSIGYALATITAFGILMIVHQQSGSFEFSAFYGLAKKTPWMAWMMVISMCSLAGIPLTAGFFGKFYVFSNAMSKNFYWLVGFGVLNAVIGIFFYFKVIIAMFFTPIEAPAEKLVVPLSMKFALGIATLATVVLGFYPSLFANLLF